MVKNHELDKKYNWLLSVAVLLPDLVLVAELMFTSALNASNVRMIGKGIIGVYFGFLVLRYYKRLLPKLLIFSAGFSTLFLFHLLLYPNRTAVIFDIISYFLLICLPIFVCSSEIVDAKILAQCSYIISYITILIGCLVVFFVLNSSSSYNMSFGYYMLLPCIVMLYNIYCEQSIWNIIGFVLSLGIILSLGSRGPILCIAFYVIFKELSLLRTNHIVKVSKLFFILLRIIAIICICVFYADIAKLILIAFGYLGIGSRTIEMFLKGDLAYMSNRDHIYSWAIERINEKFLLGHGIGFSIQETGTYCHNIILEFAVEYGVLIAGVLIGMIILIIWYKLRHSNFLWRDTILIWISVGIIPLFVSGLYWTSMHFWCCMGMMSSTGKKYIVAKKMKGLR